MGKGMIYAAWVLLLAMLTWLFHGWLETERNPNRRPDSRMTADGLPEVRLRRNRAGHYLANGAINGEPVTFLLDTGATDVALPLSLAQRLRLDLGAEQRAMTANGPVRAWSARLSSVSLGAIRQSDVRASVLPNMADDQVLLGMSFLKRLEWSQRGDVLLLRAR